GQGDPGGISYGKYQFALRAGTPARFVAFLAGRAPPSPAAAALQQAAPGTPAFAAAWKAAAAQDPAGFGQAQPDFVMASYSAPVRQSLLEQLRLDLRARALALSDVVWSSAVQHGPRGAVNLFTAALGATPPDRIADASLIQAVYAERGRTDAAGVLVH